MTILNEEPPPPDCTPIPPPENRAGGHISWELHVRVSNNYTFVNNILKSRVVVFLSVKPRIDVRLPRV